MRVRELQPYNKQAQTGISRCQKFIKQDEGTHYNPTRDELKMPELREINKKAEDAPVQEIQQPSEPVKKVQTEQKTTENS